MGLVNYPRLRPGQRRLPVGAVFGGAASPVARNAVNLLLPGHNATTPATSAGSTVNWTTPTITNQSGAPITTISLVFIGWYLTSAGTSAVGNDVPTTAKVTYLGVDTTMTAAGNSTITIPNNGSIKTDEIVLGVAIPAGASFTVSGSHTLANGLKYNQTYTQLGFSPAAFGCGLAGVLTTALPSAMRKLCLYAVGDSIFTNSGCAPYQAALSRCPSVQHSIIGSTTQSYATGTAFDKQVALATLLGVTDFVSNFGTNDVGSRTAAQIIADITTLKGKANAVSILWNHATMIPRGTNATVTASSVTSTGTTATMAVADATKFTVGQAYTVAGAVQTEYNGTVVLTAVDTGANTVSYLFPGSGTTPATGTITIKGYNFSSKALYTPTTGFEAGGASKLGLVNAWIRGGNVDGFIDTADAVMLTRDDALWSRGGEKAALRAEFTTAVITGTTPSTTVFRATYAGISGTLASGTAIFTSGVNIGLSRTINGNTGNVITLSTALPSAPSIGDTLVIVPLTDGATTDGTHPGSMVPNNLPFAGNEGGNVLITEALATFYNGKLA